MDHLAMAKGQIVQKDMRGCRRLEKKLRRLEKKLSIYMSSPLVLMLPPWTQWEVESILQDVQTTLRTWMWTQDPESFPNVDELIEKGTQMSLWLKDMATNVLRVTRTERSWRAI